MIKVYKNSLDKFPQNMYIPPSLGLKRVVIITICFSNTYEYLVKETYCNDNRMCVYRHAISLYDRYIIPYIHMYYSIITSLKYAMDFYHLSLFMCT